jgi:hypothetical protein
VGEAFSNVAMLFLISLPLATAAIGWVAATVTARVAYGDLVEANDGSLSAAGGNQSRSFGLLLLLAALAVAAITAVTLFFLVR